MAVYKLHALARSGNYFTKDTRIKLERDLHVIQVSYAEKINAHSEMNGLLYEKDEEATSLYLSGKPYKNVKVYTRCVEVSEEKSLEKDDLIAEYEELSGLKTKGNWGVKKLENEISILKNKND
jgi:ribosomal protein L4